MLSGDAAVIMFKRRFCGDQVVINGIGEAGERQKRKCSTDTEVNDIVLRADRRRRNQIQTEIILCRCKGSLDLTE
jgi:hypothetical protein